ncbi:MAG TPA: hypothetical protein DDW30_05525 [Clostridiales bacterium]|nr:hypothetical protein [Clostridiales bacterium]
MKTTVIRTLLLLLTLSFLLTALAACKKDSQTPDDSVDTDEEASKYPRFNNEVLKILAWNDSSVREFILDDEAEQYNGQIVEYAVWQRAQAVQKDLNITLDYIGITGSADFSSTAEKYLSTVRASHMSGGIYDVYCGYSLFAATLTTDGIYTDLAEQKNIDFGADCWPESLVEETTINDKIYFCSGDISTNLMFMSSLIYYNKTLYATHDIDTKIQTEYGYNNIYKMVQDGKWTVDVLKELSTDIYVDMPGDGYGIWTSDDVYGFGSYSSMLRNFYWGSGMRALTMDENGLVLTDDFKNVHKVSAVLKSVGEFLTNSGDAYLLDGVESSRKAFAEGRLLFNLAPASHAYKVFSGVDGLTYGVLPVPKYDETQARYCSVSSNPYSMYGIEGNSGKIEISAAYLQCLADYSLQLTRPAIFEKTMKLFYADRGDDSLMWDIIADTQTFDRGIIFGREIGAHEVEFPLCTLFSDSLAANNSAWSTALAGNLTRINSYIDSLNKELNELSRKDG